MGFPEGLSPESWMGDLTSKKLDGDRAKSMKVTEFHYPGSHDSATYGEGLADFSYQCQNKNLYEQMKVGQRCFDLRLAPHDKEPKFIPVHGIAKGTADDFNVSPSEAHDDSLAGQIMRFAKEHPTEIIILKVSFADLDTDDERRKWADTAWNLLGPRLLEAPAKDAQMPSYAHAVESNRNIILGTEPDTVRFGQPHDITKFIWDVGGDTVHWMGEGNTKLWDEPVWQSGELDKVLQSTEEWMHNNASRCEPRNKFWTANCQLTPVLGANWKTFMKDGGSIRPKDLALGGGIGTHGHFHGSNKQLRECGALDKPVWKKHASCVLYDFADVETTGAIVAMNLP